MPSGSMSFSFCDFRRAAGVRSTPQTPCSSSWTGLPKVLAVILDCGEAGDPWGLPGVLLRRLSSVSGGDRREIQPMLQSLQLRMAPRMAAEPASPRCWASITRQRLHFHAVIKVERIRESLAGGTFTGPRGHAWTDVRHSELLSMGLTSLSFEVPMRSGRAL